MADRTGYPQDHVARALYALEADGLVRSRRMALGGRVGTHVLWSLTLRGNEVLKGKP